MPIHVVMACCSVRGMYSTSSSCPKETYLYCIVWLELIFKTKILIHVDYRNGWITNDGAGNNWPK